MGLIETRHHDFSKIILEVLEDHFGEVASDVFSSSSILGYINEKTRSANRGSKARGSFANLYALYVVVEDYIKKGFFDGTTNMPYAKYEGARFTDLLTRQRKLYFGKKLQNHALNSRLNDEFRKFFPTVGQPPIVRDMETRRYWVQEDLLLITIRNEVGHDKVYNIAKAIISIIDKYAQKKRHAFEKFLETCQQLTELGSTDSQKAIKFVKEQLAPNVDSRVFEIVSYAVLKAKYQQESVWIGETKDDVFEKCLILYKTGRTNANDGGIDFVMKPLGRFFQVTETVDADKYFLDIDKVQKFPITFVVKSRQTVNQIREEIQNKAVQKYKIERVVNSYMKSVEEIINVDNLVKAFNDMIKSGDLEKVMNEIIKQSKVEFNY